MATLLSEQLQLNVSDAQAVEHFLDKTQLVAKKLLLYADSAQNSSVKSMFKKEASLLVKVAEELEGMKISLLNAEE
ncbi:hypothetical protein MFMK1_003132 [Metallumcola ferriviriculae]|uniref:Uncharacterized protein n=1 Tax=Metallumcola ferriviriculae TaxID=3039180 RepID=A0AAU0UQP8_9FIRM|nr:hypothetical protein MFMK1_003132 [Desulfitibacteraceae bacterium MK1]